MAWTFADEFKTISELLITDARGSTIKINDTGTNYAGSAAFDLFSDSAIAGDYLAITLSRKYWGVQFEIGTAFSASAVEFIWEYSTGNHSSTTWATIAVENKNAFTLTGTQVVRFTPPLDWNYKNDTGYKIRCRIVSLTSITEGGRTSALVKWNIKPILGTGTTNMTLAAIETADLAGSYITLTATTPAASLTPIEMPVNDLKESSKLDVALAGCTLGAGDTVTITGTDQQGGALTEVIDVSGGNVTYTTTSVFRNVTDVACTGFSDGTIEVQQKRWGVITSRYSYDFTLRACLAIGDGSTTTTMTVSSTNITFSLGFFHYANQATLTFGSTAAVLSETYGVGGCTIYEGINSSSSPGMSWNRALGTSTLTYNGCRLNYYYIGSQNGGFRIANVNSSITLRDCTVRAISGQYYFLSPVLMVRVKFLGCSWWQSGTGLVDGSKELEATVSINIENNAAGSTRTYREVFVPSTAMWVYRGQLKFIDSFLTTTQMGHGYGTTDVDAIKIIFTLNMTIQDVDGTVIEGASVLIKDTNDTTFLDTTTDASGQIAETELWNATGTAYEVVGAYTWKYYNPYTITISKTGYQTKTIVYTMDKKRVEVETLEEAVKMIHPMGQSTYINLDNTNSQNKIKWAKV